MGALLWQKAIVAKLIRTAGPGASGANLGSSPAGRQAIKMPLDAGGEVSVLVRCGITRETLAPVADLFITLSFFTDHTGGQFTFKFQCDAKSPGDDGDAADWNAAESELTAAFPGVANELVHAAISIASGDARDNLSNGDDLWMLLRLLPDAGRPAKYIYLTHVDIRQEIP